jgi:hypothetical protein
VWPNCGAVPAVLEDHLHCGLHFARIARACGVDPLILEVAQSTVVRAARLPDDSR